MRNNIFNDLVIRNRNEIVHMLLCVQTVKIYSAKCNSFRCMWHELWVSNLRLGYGDNMHNINFISFKLNLLGRLIIIWCLSCWLKYWLCMDYIKWTYKLQIVLWSMSVDLIQINCSCCRWILYHTDYANGKFLIYWEVIHMRTL